MASPGEGGASIRQASFYPGGLLRTVPSGAATTVSAPRDQPAGIPGGPPPLALLSPPVSQRRAEEARVGRLFTEGRHHVEGEAWFFTDLRRRGEAEARINCAPPLSGLFIQQQRPADEKNLQDIDLHMEGKAQVDDREVQPPMSKRWNPPGQPFEPGYLPGQGGDQGGPFRAASTRKIKIRYFSFSPFNRLLWIRISRACIARQASWVYTFSSPAAGLPSRQHMREAGDGLGLVPEINPWVYLHPSPRGRNPFMYGRWFKRFLPADFPKRTPASPLKGSLYWRALGPAIVVSHNGPKNQNTWGSRGSPLAPLSPFLLD